MNRTHLIYPVLLVVFALGLYAIIEQGKKLQPLPIGSQGNGSAAPPTTVSAPVNPTGEPGSAVGPAPSLFASLQDNLKDPLPRLFVQLILIVLLARICGGLAQRLHQPAVIGEMIAGILLGPSLMGWLWPGFFNFVFPAASLGTLRLLSQIGVCLFMFVVGMELDVNLLKQQARTAMLVSQVSILFPYLLGAGTALFLFPSMAAPHTTFLAFALFMGISMSITAFPVLARILEERGLTKTPLGTTALACAASDDVTAWTILAFVVAIAKSASIAACVFSIGLVLLYVLFMLLWVKPRLARWIGTAPFSNGVPDTGVMAAVIVFIFASALTTDVIGIHALFGAFLAGVVIPSHGEFRNFLRVRLEHFSSVFLLPVFFAFTGLRTQIGLLDEYSAWLICLALILVATIGKLGGALLAARITGVNWVDSFALGALMNTRGLIELVALNIGYDLGILSPRIFAMLIVMALVTTGMTGPLLHLAGRLRTRKALAVEASG
ncbi:MAG TPA: cation:proton antiporter [Candidatus Limnocylindrales bacterium]|nr:cation:proton antiporter [Candidatus Limnocylindrales bacterium]